MLISSDVFWDAYKSDLDSLIAILDNGFVSYSAASSAIQKLKANIQKPFCRDREYNELIEKLLNVKQEEEIEISKEEEEKCEASTVSLKTI